MNTIWGAAIVPLVTYLLSILGLVGFAGYAIFRLNSTQIIREKVWSTFVGDKDFNDEKLKSFGQNQLDLTRFRLVYGVTARSVQDLHRLLSWMERHHLTPIEVKQVRARIDPSKDEPLEAPRTRHLVTRAALALLIMVGLMVTFDKASTSKTTLLTMHVSKTWLWSDGASVEGTLGNSWRLDAQSCAKLPLPGTTLTGLTNDETTAICKGIADGALRDTVNDGIKYQRRAIAVFLFFVLIVETNIAFGFGIDLRARTLARRLRSRNDTSSEPSVPLVNENPIEQ
ncbi:hypothetical protein KY49_3133 [Burkholderia sp. MSHR3999]|uniref:DUF6216 family protein n=1 Tax=Burkholderia sp. MSHR3999 TaxID=1542965 RepID=UPI0005ACF768|nr:DUF6216 family protein [Burkholderia sp. MSHR3999]KIP18725.1 hypothetical protein KY49_3133 [Burkholderia sp. MSHR3999]